MDPRVTARVAVRVGAMPQHPRTPRSRPGQVPQRPARRSGRAGSGRVAGVRPLQPATRVRPRRRRPALTGRAAVVAVVVAAVMLMLAYPLRAYVNQRHTITQLHEQSSASEQRQQRLSQEISRFDDPSYLAQKAATLGYVEPGQRRYVVANSSAGSSGVNGQVGQPDPSLQDQTAALLAGSATPAAWYDRVVHSLTRPGKPLPSP